MRTHYVGKSVPRVDGVEKVTGSAVYCVDVELPGMLFGAVLRSPLAHGKILKVDASKAWKVPGVRAVVTGRDFPHTFGGAIKDQPFLAVDRVRFVGEPVVAVAAETELAAQEAVEKVRVQYEELPAVFDPRKALEKDAPLLHPQLGEYSRTKIYEVVPGTNICTIRKYSVGDVEQGFAEADEVFEDEFYMNAVAHTPIEPHAAAAQYLAAKDEYTIWSSSDGPQRRVKELAEGLGLPHNKVRFLSTYSGGGFGGKGSMIAEVVAIALARFTKGRPVRIVYSREEELTASQTRHAAFLYLKTGMKKDGTMIARKADIVWDKGAYASKGPDVAYRGVLVVLGPYRIPHIDLRTRLVYTNKEYGGAYRGFGTNQAIWASEAQVDIIAKKMGIDPLELRLKNCYVEGDAYINGQILHGVGLKDTLERAGQAIGWSQSKPKSTGTKFRGRGIASVIKPTATPSDSACVIKMHMDGSVELLSSAMEVGAGQKTVLAQMTADAIGVPLDTISVPNSDTHLMPYDFGTTSSRITFHMGNAVCMAGGKLRERILKMAGEVLEEDPTRLTLREGKIFAEGKEEKELITLHALLTKKFVRGGSLVEEAHYSPAESSLLSAWQGVKAMSSIFWMFATHAAEVEVDIETGMVKVLKVVAAHDVGRAINPQLCEQQIEGSVIMGQSNTLLEEFKMNKGRILNDSFADYKIATTLDIPEIVPFLIESKHSEAPFGAKGVGEPAAAPTTPAIANAIFDAIGVRINELPITAEKIAAAIRKGREKKTN